MSPPALLWEDTGLGSAHRNFSSHRFHPGPWVLGILGCKARVGLLPTSGFFSKLEHPQRCSWEGICSPRKPLRRVMGILEGALVRNEAAGPLGGARRITHGKS